MAHKGTARSGGNADADPANPNPSEWDCSELVQWACDRAGVTPAMPDGSWLQQRWCSSQGQIISVDQAIACGLTADQISYRYRTGRWIRVGVRAFTIAGTPPSWEQQLAAGLLDLGPEAVVSHRAAAALHGFDGFSRSPSSTPCRGWMAARTAADHRRPIHWPRAARFAWPHFPGIERPAVLGLAGLDALLDQIALKLGHKTVN